MRIFAIIILLFLGIASGLPAAERLNAPSRYSKRSQNGLFEIMSDPEAGTTCTELSSKKMLWTLPAWYRHVVVADDGRHAATADDKFYRIPKEHDPKQVMITILAEWQGTAESDLG